MGEMRYVFDEQVGADGFGPTLSELIRARERRGGRIAHQCCVRGGGSETPRHTSSPALGMRRVRQSDGDMCAGAEEDWSSGRRRLRRARGGGFWSLCPARRHFDGVWVGSGSRRQAGTDDRTDRAVFPWNSKSADEIVN